MSLSLRQVLLMYIFDCDQIAFPFNNIGFPAEIFYQDGADDYKRFIMNEKPLQSESLCDYFSGWHPLRGTWPEELAPEIQEIVRYAQQCLINNRRTDQEIADALAQMRAWRQAYPRLVDTQYAPEVIFDENLGTQFEPSAFAAFLLAQESPQALKPYEFAALALLLEAFGLADLPAVARKDTLSPVAQHLALKIARKHIVTVLLCLIGDNPDCRDTILAIMSALLSPL